MMALEFHSIRRGFELVESLAPDGRKSSLGKIPMLLVPSGGTRRLDGCSKEPQENKPALPQALQLFNAMDIQAQKIVCKGV